MMMMMMMMFSLDSHWEVQFINPEKGPKSEENDPPPLSEVGYGPVISL